MKTSPQSSDGSQADPDRTSGADPHAPKEPRSLEESAAPLPHESDQSAGSQQEDAPREIGKQAHSDLERGLADTDRRGGGDYQQSTQNDAQTDVNAGRQRAPDKPSGSDQ